jgi:hypothetical protein
MIYDASILPSIASSLVIGLLTQVSVYMNLSIKVPEGDKVIATCWRNLWEKHTAPSCCLAFGWAAVVVGIIQLLTQVKSGNLFLEGFSVCSFIFLASTGVGIAGIMWQTFASSRRTVDEI